MVMSALEYNESRQAALLVGIFDRSPHLFDEFERSGEVPSPFSITNADVLDAIRRAVKSMKDNRLRPAVSAAKVD